MGRGAHRLPHTARRAVPLARTLARRLTLTPVPTLSPTLSLTLTPTPTPTPTPSLTLTLARRARSLVFALRRALWLFLLTRDIALFGSMRHRKGLAGALVPPAISLSLLALDQMWWTEHAAQVQRCSAVAASDAGDREGDISEKLLAPSSQLLGAPVDRPEP